MPTMNGWDLHRHNEASEGRSTLVSDNPKAADSRAVDNLKAAGFRTAADTPNAAGSRMAVDNLKAADSLKPARSRFRSRH